MPKFKKRLKIFLEFSLFHYHIFSVSAPVSPKKVIFEDEIERQLAEQLRQQRATVSPTGGMYSRPEKYRFQPIVTPPITSRSTAYPAQARAPSRADTETLDEATLDMLRMSAEPTAVTFSGTARISPNADRLQKAASTSSMHKVIRTQVNVRQIIKSHIENFWSVNFKVIKGQHL